MKLTDLVLTNASSKISVWAGDRSSSTLICLPAMGVRASYYDPFATALNERGFNVISADWRGNGHSSLRASRRIDFGYKELMQDVGSILDFAEIQFPGTDKIIVGHSLGGQIGSLYAAQYPSAIGALILIASCSVYHKGWKGLAQLRVILAGILFYPISLLVGYLPGKEIGFGGQEARSVIRDWSYTIRHGTYQPYGTNFDFEKALSQLLIPRLAISIKGDQLAPEAAVSRLLDKFNAALPATLLHVSDHESAIPALNHFNWAKKPQYFADLIQNWIGTL